MFGDLNRAEIIGNITNDLQVRYTGSGSAVLSFGVATNRRYKAQNSDEWKDEPSFHNIVVWGKQAEGLASRARKGTRIYISGRLQTRSWDDADGKKNYKTEIVADQLILLDRYEKGSSNDDSFEDSVASTKVKPQPKKQAASNQSEEEIIDPDDLPF